MKSARVLRFAVSAIALVAIPAVSHAQEQTLGTFRGRVDREIRITMRGGDVSSSTLSGADLRSRYRLSSPLPLQEGTVRVALENGRGDVSVVQQPAAANNYTAIVRVYDRSSGADVYRFTTYFTPSLNVSTNRPGGILGRGRRGNVPTLHWSGDVDGALELRWRGGNVTQRVLSGNAIRNASSSVSGNDASGRQPQEAVVTVREGRGQVQVIQQPSAQNRYTTIVRITDPARGYGHYDLDAAWR